MLDFLAFVALHCAGRVRSITAFAASATIAAIAVTRAPLAGLAAFLAFAGITFRVTFGVARRLWRGGAGSVAAAVVGARATVIATTTATA